MDVSDPPCETSVLKAFLNEILKSPSFATDKVLSVAALGLTMHYILFAIMT